MFWKYSKKIFSEKFATLIFTQPRRWYTDVTNALPVEGMVRVNSDPNKKSCSERKYREFYDGFIPVYVKINEERFFFYIF
jgi:hypothetical protein